MALSPRFLRSLKDFNLTPKNQARRLSGSQIRPPFGVTRPVFKGIWILSGIGTPTVPNILFLFFSFFSGSSRTSDDIFHYRNPTGNCCRQGKVDAGDMPGHRGLSGADSDASDGNLKIRKPPPKQVWWVMTVPTKLHSQHMLVETGRMMALTGIITDPCGRLVEVWSRWAALMIWRQSKTIQCFPFYNKRSSSCIHRHV